MRFDLRDKGLLLWTAVILTVTGALLIVLPFVVQAIASSGPAPSAPTPAASLPISAENSRGPSNSSSTTDAAGQPIYSAAAPSSAASFSVQATAAPAAAARKPAAKVKRPAAAPVANAIDAYRGLGCWVDIYDDRAWKDPSAAVADMAAHGTVTLYLETSNSRSPFAIKSPALTSEFIDAAHARGMKVVAWYLPDMTSPGKDYSRIASAIRFTSTGGGHFDSFALDIESSALKSESKRNAALTALSTKIRALVGDSYPLGGITPSPVGLAKKLGYWDAFPYQMVASKYDVLVPMSYYTYHGKGASAAYSDTVANMRILRAQPGCATVPVHLIGGIAENTSASELHQFVRAAKECGAVGGSLYEWAGTSAAYWRELGGFSR